jgi:hypothetical protein
MHAIPRLAPILILLSSALSDAATLTWPGVAPCNGTLQACIDAAVPGDTVEIATNAPVVEDVLVRKSLHLRPAPGRRPVLARSLDLQVPNLSPGLVAQITVEGITLAESGIRVMHATSTSGVVRLRGNVIQSVPLAGSWFNGAAVRVTAASSRTLELEITGNLIDARLPVPGYLGHAGLVIAGEGSGELTGLIARNRVLMHAAPSAPGIGVQRERGDTNLRIGLNRIEGSNYGHGIRFMATGTATASHIVAVYNNVVVGQQHPASGAGIVIRTDHAEVLSQVLSNTVTHGQRGLLVEGAVDMQLANNLFAYNGEDVLIDDSGAVEYQNNLSHGNGQMRLAGTAGLVTGSPRLAYDGFRTRPGSAATDAGDADIGMSPMDFVDIDGLPRYKGAAIDIGAFESGSRHVLHRAGASNTFANISRIGTLMGMPGANPQLTQNWNPVGSGGVYNNQPVGIYYNDGRWIVFNENFAPMPMSAGFNVFVPGTQSSGHLSAPANTFDGASLINRDDLNGRPDAFLLATHDWSGHGSPGQYMTTRWGIAYLGGWWNLIDLEAPFPYGRGFNLHIQWRSPSAFVHTSTAGNVQVNWTTIDHPALNGRRCALLQVTPRTDGDMPALQQLGVWYTPEGRWAVFHQGFAPMPLGVRMHVLFDPAQVESCSRESIFRDGIEAVPYRAA